MPARRDAIAGALRQRVVGGLHLGTLKAGDRLPSLRQLAAETGADPRVVLAAYRQLAREGLVGLRTRSGAYVDAGAPGVSDEISVKRILTALGLSPPEDEKPPPIREVLRVPVDDEGREIQASWTAPSILTL